MECLHERERKPDDDEQDPECQCIAAGEQVRDRGFRRCRSRFARDGHRAEKRDHEERLQHGQNHAGLHGKADVRDLVMGFPMRDDQDERESGRSCRYQEQNRQDDRVPQGERDGRVTQKHAGVGGDAHCQNHADDVERARSRFLHDHDDRVDRRCHDEQRQDDDAPGHDRPQVAHEVEEPQRVHQSRMCIDDQKQGAYGHADRACDKADRLDFRTGLLRHARDAGEHECAGAHTCQEQIQCNHPIPYHDVSPLVVPQDVAALVNCGGNGHCERIVEPNVVDMG